MLDSHRNTGISSNKQTELIDELAVKSIRKSTLLRRAIQQGCVMMPGAFNAATARLVEHAGFRAVYVSGAGLANATAGVPDIGLLTLTEVAQLAGYIADAVRIPAVADADTGFGGPENVARSEDP